MTQINEVTTLTREGDIAVVTLNSPPVNALSANVREGLFEGFKAAIADDAAKAIVLICDGRTFIAGADITEFGQAPKGPGLHEVQAMIEDAPKPVVAAVHGTALGGGLEVALVCHYRVVVPSARMGLPEVNLGLLPGAGGTQRLPRVTGVEKALEMMTSGRHASAKEAHESGLADAIVEEGKLLEGAIAFAQKIVADNAPLTKIRERDDKVAGARGKPEIFEAFRKSIARKTRGFLAPEYNIQCIEAAVNLPFDEGMKVEAKLFRELVTGEQSAAQRHVFFAERQVAKIPDVPKDTPQIDVKSVGIIGAGTMGGGIAMNFVNAGIPVTIVEQAQERLDAGLAVVRKNYENSAKRGRFPMEEVDKRMAMFTGTTNLEDLADKDLIIEAIFENMDVKKDVFGKLDKIVKQGSILATNTSALDIDEIATATTRPEAVIGLHFFSPANVMKLLEIVRADKTSNEVIATSMSLAKKIGKVGVLVGVCPGFVGNRLLAQRQREANKLILEGAMPWDVDRVLFDFGLPMGPFAMSDLAGLDLGWNKETSKGETLRDLLCERDRRGQKTGAGFYDYDENRVPSPSKEVEGIIRQYAEERQIQQREISDEEILERCLLPMVNEGYKILEEGKAIRASDIDIVWIMGYGWPRYRGGPMWYGENSVGLEKVLERMQHYEEKHGADFKPAAMLEDLVAESKKKAG
ncbi:Enoyl-CoA hydratase / 3-hydroxyacyl-CoA dehydrogenase / 3-hydroxybutyryl-CoA epimerase [Candidatus Phaeomarinobacter ectocarpi]|uniref:Enoyl-CoA hydratase / 3-hydroxyacyl-CoA dehydrogenase / 3-hydroxybutyryl-CoA epimerase n=1 Tax=Candidatus Phaeomarinibacter ectocarpi TaxID=1458461 RepID=X5ME49_9HYPH|nr:Enoyl-CoA hydratase / 3-hydroxyacyl-CoA dehydrogenase / 3-hydroxybutyryl-CoA epimerase [Candidatus Phaeomarinobacter ectocarpi]